MLCGTGPLHRHTCATLIRAGVQVVGIVTCDRRGFLANFRFLLGRVRRYGLRLTVGQVLGRVADRVVNGRFDRHRLGALVNESADRALLQTSPIPRHHTSSYSAAETLAWIAAQDPDILVVHTKFIVGRRVRALAKVAVLGGHPGLTPWYRGAYSAFWALRRGQPERVGWTVFLIDDGIDTGPIVRQGQLRFEPGTESHNSLGWRGMVEEAAVQAQTIRRLDDGVSVPIRPVTEIPPDSYFGPPTLRDILEFRRVQRGVR